MYSLYFDEGVHQYDQKNYSAALKSFTSALNEGGDERAIPKIGLAAYQAKEYDICVNHCQKYIQFPECKLILGVCYYSAHGVAENFEKSERLLKGAAAEGHRLAKLNLGILFNTMGKYGKVT